MERALGEKPGGRGGEGSRQRRREARRRVGQRASGLGESRARGSQHRPRQGGRGVGRGGQGISAERRRKAQGWETRGPEGSDGGAGSRPEPAPQGPRAGPGKEAARLGGTYWGPSARRRWGSPPAGEGRGSPGRPGGPGSGRTGQWSRPWLREPRSGTHLTSPRPAPRRPTATAAEPALLKPRRGGETTPEAVSALEPAAPELCACAGRPRRRGWRGPSHVTGGRTGEPTSTWTPAAGLSPSSAPTAGNEPFYSFWL